MFISYLLLENLESGSVITDISETVYSDNWYLKNCFIKWFKKKNIVSQIEYINERITTKMIATVMKECYSCCNFPE